MTIPYVGGLGEDIGPGLSAIADAVGQILNPNEQFRRQAQALFLEKPELMQKFVDVEKANPGTLKAFGFGDKATNLLSGMQESIPALVARKIAPKVADELQDPNSLATRSATTQAVSGQTPGQLQTEDFAGWFAGEGKKLLDSDPELFIRAARAKFGTGTEFENELENDAQKNYHSAEYLRDTPPMQIVKDIVGGRIPMSEISGLLVGPEKQSILLAVDLYKQDREAALRMNLSKYGATSEATFRAKFTKAYDSWQDSGRKGSLQGWYNYLWKSPDIGAPLPGDDEAIATALKDEQSTLRTEQLTKMFKSVEPLIKAVEDGVGDESAMKERISRINEVLKQNHSQWSAFWNEKGLFNFGKLSFRSVDETGNMLITDDPSAIMSEVAPAGVETLELTPQQEAVAARLKGMSGAARTALIQQIRAQATSPEVAAAIIQKGGGE